MQFLLGDGESRKLNWGGGGGEVVTPNLVSEVTHEKNSLKREFSAFGICCQEWKFLTEI